MTTPRKPPRRTPKGVKPVKAWAIVDAHGIFCPWVHTTRSGCIKLFVGSPHDDVLSWAYWTRHGARCRRVLITLSPKGRKRK